MRGLTWKKKIRKKKKKKKISCQVFMFTRISTKQFDWKGMTAKRSKVKNIQLALAPC